MVPFISNGYDAIDWLYRIIYVDPSITNLRNVLMSHSVSLATRSTRTLKGLASAYACLTAESGSCNNRNETKKWTNADEGHH